MKRFRLLSTFFCIAAVAGALSWHNSSLAQSEEEGRPSDQPVAVEKSMHDLMAYVFQPAYKRLKLSLATAPADRLAWRAVMSDSLTLAESNNLLLHRKPEQDVADWLRLAAAARTEGSHLYHAAKNAAYADAQVHYAAMLTQCNACHQQFAKGKHQLEK